MVNSAALSFFNANLNRIELLMKQADGIIKNGKIKLPDRLDIINQLTDASIILVSAYFENFLREIGSEFAKEIQGIVPNFYSLPIEIQDTHVDYIPHWIQRTRPSLDRSEKEEVARRYGSPFPSGLNYELIGESFGDCLANPNCETVNDMFKLRMGIKITQKASINSNVIIAQYSGWLKTFNDIRNAIAHGDPTRSPVAPSDVRYYVSNFSILSNFMIGIIQSRLNEIKKGQLVP